MKHDTYKHYVLANGLKDTKETYKDYTRLLMKEYPSMAMSETLLDQYVKATYIYRFSVCK